MTAALKYGKTKKLMGARTRLGRKWKHHMLRLKSKTKKKWIMDEREALAMFENNNY